MQEMEKNYFNIASNYPNEARLLRFLLGVTLLSLAVGLVAPIITLKKFVFIENTFSVLSGTLQLLKSGQFFLFVLIFVFSICLPVLKIIALYMLLGKKKRSRVRLDVYLHWMNLYGKWSMLDVFVVAVMVVAIKLGAVASAEMRYGLYLFATAVVLTMLITARVVRLTNELKK